MVQRIIGVQIGNEQIKLIETTRKKGGGLHIERCVLLDTPPNTVSNGTIIDVDGLQEKLAEQLQQNGFRGKKTILVFESTDTINRTAIINKQNHSAIRSLLESKPEDYLPISNKEYQIDYKVMREFIDEKGQQKMEIMVVAVPNTIIGPMIQLMDGLKLDIQRITIPSEALTKIFSAETGMIPDLPEESCVINVGKLSSTVTFIHAGEAHFYKTVDFGLNGYHNLLEESYLTSDVSLMPPELRAQYDAQVRDVAYPFIERQMIRPLERLIQFYTTRFAQKAMETIYIIGGGASVDFIDTYISEAVGVPVVKIKYPEGITAHELTNFTESSPYFVDILGAINGL